MPGNPTLFSVKVLLTTALLLVSAVAQAQKYTISGTIGDGASGAITSLPLEAYITNKVTIMTLSYQNMPNKTVFPEKYFYQAALHL